MYIAYPCVSCDVFRSISAPVWLVESKTDKLSLVESTKLISFFHEQNDFVLIDPANHTPRQTSGGTSIDTDTDRYWGNGQIMDADRFSICEQVFH